MFQYLQCTVKNFLGSDTCNSKRRPERPRKATEDRIFAHSVNEIDVSFKNCIRSKQKSRKSCQCDNDEKAIGRKRITRIRCNEKNPSKTMKQERNDFESNVQIGRISTGRKYCGPMNRNLNYSKVYCFCTRKCSVLNAQNRILYTQKLLS